MIVLDTNVVSEAIKPEPNLSVQAWLNDQMAETLYLSSVTVAELLFGVAMLPSGKRKDKFAILIQEVVELYEDRILSFDMLAAYQYANLAAIARSNGKGFPTPDGYIAAIAVSRKFLVASRDTAPYLAAGVAVINPWED